MKNIVLLLINISYSLVTYAQGNFALANLGNFRLVNGDIIQDCTLAYRTFGKPNKAKSNTILFPTYFSGTSKDIAGSVGPGKLADSTKYFVVLIDALGNGVSSSPSTSSSQKGKSFPQFGIQDMVNAQYAFVTKQLQLQHVQAVMGISMGGMQAFQWMVSYPAFMDKVISIVGTPTQTSQDLLLWKAQLSAIESIQNCGDDGQKAMPTVAAIHNLALATARHRVAQTDTGEFDQFLTNAQKSTSQKNAYDWASQLRAMINHDIYKTTGKPATEIGNIVKARVLIIAALQDQMVNPLPSLELAQILNAQKVELTGDCGHLANSCESAKVTEAVTKFLDEK